MFGSQHAARRGRGQRGLRSVIKSPLPRTRPLLARPCGLAVNEAPRDHSDRKADSQEPREMVRPDIDGVEMHRESEHHHRVLRAWGEGHNHVGDAKRKQRHNNQREQCSDGHRYRKRAKGRRQIAQQYLWARIRESCACDRAQREHGGAAGPPRQRNMDQIRPMKKSRAGHGAEQGPPGNLMYSMASAERPDAVRRIASSTSEGSVAPRVDTTGSTVEPNSASPAGRPSTINSTRITCTIARTSASNSADSAITCAIEPGLAPSNADKRSQPCAKRR